MVEIEVVDGPSYSLLGDMYYNPHFEARLRLRVKLENHCFRGVIIAYAELESPKDIPKADDMKKILDFALGYGRRLLEKKAKILDELLIDYMRAGFWIEAVNDEEDYIPLKSIVEVEDVDISRSVAKRFKMQGVKVKYDIFYLKRCKD